jgi:general secretion pathway protein C
MDLRHKIRNARNTALARPAAEWLNLANERLPAISSLVLAVLIAWYISRLAWALLPAHTEFDWNVRSPVSNSLSISTDTPQADYLAVANAHIFGVPGKEAVIEQTTDAPDTSLNLKLRGAIAATDPAYAHAIIADGSGNDNVYFVNDKLPGGAVLHEIQMDRVILNRAGRLEALRLPKLSEGLGKPTPRAGRSALNLIPPPRGSTSTSATLSRPAGFTDIMRPQPFMPNGEMKGYRIYPGRDRRKFASLGFRPGDLVTAINGQPLNDLQRGIEVFKSLGSAAQLSLTIERSGNPLVLTLDTADFNNPTEPE